MRILFITDNFPPEINAPATRTYEHCREWVKSGVKVTVITCFPNFPQGKVYPGYRNRLYQREQIDGMEVIRVWSYITANEGFLKRTLDYISFGATAFIASLFCRCNVIIATSPQFFSAVSANTAGFIKRKLWIMEVRDLWPESIKTVGAMKAGRTLRLLEKLELYLYRRAAKVVVVTESFKTNLVSRGVKEGKIHIIKNGANFELFRPREKDTDLVGGLGLENKFVIGYTGTHGMAHKLDFILQCAARLNSTYPFQFLFIGDGAEKEKLKTLARDLHLKNILFEDAVRKDEMPRYLSILDLALIPLKRSPAFTTVIPSKIFETAAMRIPILLGVEGEAKQLIEKYDAGLCFEPENQDDFIQKLMFYYENRQRLRLRFQAGCDKLAADFDRKRLAAEMLDIIKSIAVKN